jgi:hypothetical protein
LFRSTARRVEPLFLCLVPYHQDVFGLLREKSRVPGIVGLFSDDDALLSALTGELQAQSTAMVTINAFPKLNASTLIYKLNPKAKETKNRLQAIDATLNQWLDAYPACRKTGMVLCISAVQAMRDGGWEVLGSLLTRAEEMAIPLTLILTGTSDLDKEVFFIHVVSDVQVHQVHELGAIFQVVHHQDVGDAFIIESFNDVTSDKTRAAGNDDHSCGLQI